MLNGDGGEKALAQLKIQLRGESEAAANSATQVIQLKEQLKDINQSFREQNHLVRTVHPDHICLSLTVAFPSHSAGERDGQGNSS